MRNDIRYDSSNRIIVDDQTNITATAILSICGEFTNLNTYFLRDVLGDCLYFNDLPYINLADLRASNGEALSHLNKHDVLAYLNKHKVIKSFIDGKETTVPLDEYKKVLPFLQDVYLKSPLLLHMLNYIESYIMVVEHDEGDIVLHDNLDISNTIVLCDDIVTIYDTFSDLLIDRYPEISEDLAVACGNYCNKLLDSIINSINGDRLCSVKIKPLTPTTITVTMFESPSSRRYKLNCSIQKENRQHEKEQEVIHT